MHAALRVEGHKCSRGRVERLMRWRNVGFGHARPTAAITCRSRPICLRNAFRNRRRSESGSPISRDRRVRTGCTRPRVRPGDRQDRRMGDADHMRTELPLVARMIAAQRQRPAPGLICYSDRGLQYAARAYVDYLKMTGAVSSSLRW